MKRMMRGDGKGKERDKKGSEQPGNSKDATEGEQAGGNDAESNMRHNVAKSVNLNE
jgi:hypothetical protein